MLSINDLSLQKIDLHPGHGSNFRVFDPLDFIAHLTAHIPNHHEKRVIWYGHYSNKSRGMRKKQAALAGQAPTVSQAEIVGAAEDRAPLARISGGRGRIWSIRFMGWIPYTLLLDSRRYHIATDTTR